VTPGLLCCSIEPRTVVRHRRCAIFAVQLADDAQLRPLEIWHADEFAAHMDRARDHIRPWVGPAFVTTTVDQARATLSRYATGAAADGARLYGIWLDGRLCGGVMFVHFDAHTGVCEMGCWLEPQAEGRGLVSTACRLLLAWAFDVRHMHRVEWRCRVENTQSAQVAQRLNMTLEGVLRQSWPVQGVHYDKQVWAILADEWRAHNAPPSR
jgi:ribosomal-protein-serine acetyltransferase